MFKMFQVRKKSLPLIFLVVLFVVFLIVWRIYHGEPASVVKVTPVPGSEEVPLDVEGRVFFNRELSDGDISKINIEVIPAIPVSFSKSLEENSITFNFQEDLEPNTRYTLVVSGETVEEYRWRFRTEVSEAEGSGAKGSPQFSEAEQEYYQQNPLIQITPYVTDAFKVTRIGKKSARVYFYEGQELDAKDRVLQWFRSEGVDPEDIEIEWVE